MITTRRIGPGDREAFEPLLKAFFEHAGNPWPGEEPFARFFGRVATGRSTLVFLGAFRDDALLGIASVVLVESSFSFQPFAYADDIYVSPDARGRGAGRALLEEVQGVAAGWGASSVLVGVGDDATARRLYERAGFRPLGSLFVLPLG